MSGEMQDGAATGLDRVPTGIAGLDAVLKGGLFAGTAYIVRGAPGAGKTILANQACFHHVRQGGRALYVTLLAESHGRMLQHMGGLSFFDPAALPDRLAYISGFRILQEAGLPGLLDLLRREVRARRATLLIVDGLLAMGDTAAEDVALRKFIHGLQVHASTQGCLALLLMNGSRSEHHPEHTMVDGLIKLGDERVGDYRQRALEVLKFRGSAFLQGRHAFSITRDGIVLYPRIEALLAGAQATGVRPGRVSLGVPALDAMLGGGMPPDSSTLLLGAPGSGKTTLGMHYMALSSEQEPGLYYGFYETPPEMLANAARIGCDLRGLQERGHLEIQWQPAAEQILDDVGGRLLEAVRRRGVRRLFLDGAGALMQTAVHRDRVSTFMAALSREFRALGVTTLYTAETANLVGPNLEAPLLGVSAAADNMILLRYVELHARLYRLLSILKTRSSGFDTRLREFRVTDRGIELLDTFEGAHAILSGFATEDRNAPEERDAPPGRGPA